MKRALILIDIQNDYFSGGKMELVEMEAAAENAAKLLLDFRLRQHKIFHIQHFSVHPGATFFVPGTEGVETHNSVSPQAEETVIQKNFPNSFRETALLDSLRESDIADLVLCGAMSHMCIDATARAAFDHGFQSTVVEDACATRDLSFDGQTIRAAQVHGAFMAALGSVYARLVTTEEYRLDDGNQPGK